MSHAFKKHHLKPWGLEIVNKYPLIFTEADADIADYVPEGAEVNLRYGFECDQGWKGLIEDLAETATSLIEYLRAKGEEGVFIHGFICKEKFGTLRWQGTYNLSEPFDDLWNAYISSIENRSCNVCEKTGGYGKLCRKESGWLRTLCKEEAEKNNFVYEETF